MHETTLINLYSDTVTKPTAQMRRAIAEAEVGDDMVGEDPTVNRLEAMVAELLGKEAAVFACSATQANQMAVRTHCLAGDELLSAAQSHVACSEAGGPAALSGVTTRAIPDCNGCLDVDVLEGQILPDDQHLCRTRLLVLENTTNAGGGRVYPLEQIQRVGRWGRENGLKVHLDGARLFNAVVASGHSAAEICQEVDTVTVCFSKGLGCPMGAALVGSKEAIAKARRARKLLGGALRQAGIVAAAAVHALEHHVARLAVDHENAGAFARAIVDIDGISVDPGEIETNIVFFGVDPALGTAKQLATRAYREGLKIGALRSQAIRICTHLDADLDDVLEAAKIIRRCVREGFAETVVSAAGPYESSAGTVDQNARA